MEKADPVTTRQGPSKCLAGNIRARSEVYKMQATSTHATSTASISNTTSQSQEDPESTKTSFESVRGKCEEDNHSPDNMARSPSNSGSKSHLRAASQGVSQSPDGSLGGPLVAFSARLPNIRAQIATNAQNSSLASIQATELREPVPAKQLPNITETLGDLAPSRQSHWPLTPDLNRYAENTPAPTPSVDSNGLTVNPYIRRADEIGPAHGIPGIGHVGTILTPPGWKIGDVPITDTEADDLYDDARAQAVKELDAVVRSRETLTAAEHLQRSAQESGQWQRQLSIDNFCLGERKWIFHKWQERQASRHSQVQQYHPIHTQAQVNVVPTPVHPPTQTSIYAYQQHQQSQVLRSPLVSHFSSPLSAGSVNNRLQCLQRGLHIPMHSPISPAFLDPNLVPQTLDSIYAHYRANRIVIMQMHDENEIFLTSWTSKFGLARPQGLPITPMPQYMNGSGQQARPFASTVRGYDFGQHNVDIKDTSLDGQHGGSSLTEGLPKPPRAFYGQSSDSENSNIRREEQTRRTSQPEKMALLERQHLAGNCLPKRAVQQHGTPQPDKGGGSRVEGPIMWKQQGVEHPSTPTTTANQGRKKTGSEFWAKAQKQPDSTQEAVRRGEKPVVDARKGFSVSMGQARHLVSLGTSNSTTIPQAAISGRKVPAASGFRPITSVRTGLSIMQPPSSIIARGSAATVAIQSNRNADSHPTGHSPAPSSDSPDNTKDATFGEKCKRKTAAPRTNAPGRKIIAAGKKRKTESTELAATKKARSHEP